MNFRNNAVSGRVVAAALFLVLSWFGKASAHYPWIEMEDYAPAGQVALQFKIGWGHSFPADDFLGDADLEDLFILSTTGEKIAATPKSATEFISRQALAEGGSLLVAGQRKPGFYTKTIDGGKRQSKKGLDNVVKCSFSTMGMKGIVNVGGGGKSGVDQVAGHPLEIIPLANPSHLKVGAILPIRVLFDGKPLSGEITAVCHGYADNKEIQAASISTDLNGRGEIIVSAPGVWLLKAQHEQPFSQPEECDVESYVATLTFAVR